VTATGEGDRDGDLANCGDCEVRRQRATSTTAASGKRLVTAPGSEG
jgi:hypothetical protein